MSTERQTSFRRQCFYVWAGVEEGRVVCSVGADSTDPEFDAAAVAHTTTEDLIDHELRFQLSQLVDDIVESYQLFDGAISSEAQPTVRAIEAELKAMLVKIATLRFQEVA
jgi:hypothetical protein